MTGRGQGWPRQSRVDVGRAHRPASVADGGLGDPGQRGAARASTCSPSVVSRASDSADVAVGERAHGREHASAARGCRTPCRRSRWRRRAPRRAGAADERRRRPTCRARRRSRGGGAASVGSARRRRRPGSAAAAYAFPDPARPAPCCSGRRPPSRSARTAWRAAAAASAPRDVRGTRRSVRRGRSSPGNGRRHRADRAARRGGRRHAGPPHLRAERGRARLRAHRQRERGPRRPPASTQQGHAGPAAAATSSRGWRVPDLVVGRPAAATAPTPRAPRGGGAGRAGPRPGPRRRRARAAWAGDCATVRRAGRRSARRHCGRSRPVPVAAGQAEQAVHSVGARGARSRPRRRAPRGTRRRPRGRCRGAAGRRAPAPCRRRGSAYPRSSAASRVSRAAGCSRVEDALRVDLGGAARDPTLGPRPKRWPVAARGPKRPTPRAARGRPPLVFAVF